MRFEDVGRVEGSLEMRDGEGKKKSEVAERKGERKERTGTGRTTSEDRLLQRFWLAIERQLRQARVRISCRSAI